MRHPDLAGKLKKRDAFHNRRNATQSSFGWLAAATKRDKCYQSNDEKKVRVHIELGRNEIACAVSAIAPLMLGACLAAPLGVLLASIWSFLLLVVVVALVGCDVGIYLVVVVAPCLFCCW